MPNVKIYVDETLYPACRDRLAAALGPLRDLMCREFGVEVPACQFAVLPVMAMADLPPVNVEVMLLPRPERTRQAVTRVGLTLREILGLATGAHVAIRVAFLDPETYIALK